MSHTPSHRDQQAADVYERQQADVVDARRTDETTVDRHDAAHEKFGGFNWGSCFFGWLVAIAIAILLTSIIGAVVAAVGSSTSVTQSDAERQAGDIGLAAGIVLLLVLAIGYYFGGYVAGRMSRFDGGRQGLGVWIVGLLMTILLAAAGALLGSEYNVFSQLNLPRIPVDEGTLTTGGVIALVAAVLITIF